MPDDPSALFYARLEQAGRLLVVVDEDLLHETVDVREAALVSAAADRLACSQTEPPLPPGSAGRELELVALPLAREPAGAGPVGRRAVLREAAAAALVFVPCGAARAVSLRTLHRRPVRPEWGLRLRLEGCADIRLLDVSARGVLAATREAAPAPGQRLRFALGQGEEWEVEGAAVVLRSFAGQEPGETRLALALEPEPPGRAALLQRKLSALS